MANTVVSLQDLTKQINEREAELDKLRREFEARKGHLDELTRRKQELEGQLREVDELIAAADQTSVPAAAPAAASKAAASKAAPPANKTAPPATKTAAPASKSAGSQTLPEFIIGVLREAQRPMTSRELAAEVERRGFPTISQNIRVLVDTRISQMVRQNLLRRKKNGPGVMLSRRAKGMEPADVTVGKKTAAVAGGGSPQPAGGKRPSLQVVLRNVLAKSTRPLSARELGQAILASGYESSSADFTNVVWATASKVPDVENVKDVGYRLKKKSTRKG